ncbi:MAG: hypothetical protein KAJ01_01065 [Candidatus Hydrogenedentes bacterium]|nr:hypothetical protein [Candidatus Hydrogenedentota bacterium]
MFVLLCVLFPDEVTGHLASGKTVYCGEVPQGRGRLGQYLPAILLKPGQTLIGGANLRGDEFFVGIFIIRPRPDLPQDFQQRRDHRFGTPCPVVLPNAFRCGRVQHRLQPEGFDQSCDALASPVG